MHLLPTATSTDEARRSANVAVLPVGSFEQHGGHLPLATDTIVASAIASRLADTYDLFLLPPITVSCSHEHEDFPGTVSIGSTTLIAVINDIRASLARSGIEKLALVNGHGGNHLLSNVVQEANATGRHMVLFPGRADWVTARLHAGIESSNHDDMHGGELETSILLHAVPDLVRPSYVDADHETSDRPYLLLLGMKGYTDTGIIGYPSAATPEKARAVLDSLSASFADHHKALVT